MRIAANPSHSPAAVKILLPVLLLFSLTATASANAGTPLIWTTGLHLLFGNLIIGVFEGRLLTGFFQLRQRWTIPVMILANYTSAWTAVALMGTFWQDRDLLNLDNLKWIFCAMIAAAWVATILIEWPFIRFCFRGTENAWKSSARASIAVQTISYVLMMALYWFVSGTTLLTGVTVVKPTDFRLPDKMEIYYIAPADGDVYRRTVSGGEPEKVFDLNSKSARDRLFATPVPDGEQTGLKARLTEPDRTIDLSSGLEVPDLTLADRPEERDTWLNFGTATKLADPAESEWEFKTGFWGTDGLVATNRKHGGILRLSLETPFVTWHARNAIHLPDDLVLFQLGHNQICVFDPATRRIACLWRGRGFVAVIPAGE